MFEKNDDAEENNDDEKNDEEEENDDEEEGENVINALGKVWAQRASGTFSISMNYLYTLSYCQTGGLFLDPRDRIGIRPG